MQQPLVFAPVVPSDGQGLFNTGSQRTAPIISPPPTVGSYATLPFPSPDCHGFPQAESLNTQLTTPHPASPILCTISQSPSSNVPTPSEHTDLLLPSTTPCTKLPVEVIAFKKPQWSVKYNPGIEKVLDITFVHAFQHSSPVYSVRFSADGNFLAAGLDYGLGRTHMYDVNDKSMTWYVFFIFQPNTTTDSLCPVPWLNFLTTPGMMTFLHVVYGAYVLAQMVDT